MDMEVLLNYYPVMKNLCAKLHYNDIKALSLLSHKWWDGMETIIVNRSILRPQFDGLGKSYSKVKRAYKNIHIFVDLELLDVLPKPEEIVSLKLSHMRIRNLEDVSEFTLTGITEFEIENKDGEDNFMPELVRTILHQNNGITKLVFTDTTNIDTLIDISEVRLNKLKEFHLHSANVDLNKLEVFIRNHHDLKDCSFLGVRVTDDFIEVLQQSCQFLQALSLHCDEITDKIIQSLNKIKTLKKFHTNCKFSTESCRRNMSVFEDLSFPRYSNFNSTALKNILSPLSNLRFLSLSDAFDQTIITFIAEHMPNLTTLIIFFEPSPVLWNQTFQDANFKELKCLELKSEDVIYRDVCVYGDNFLCSIFAPKLERFFMSPYYMISEKGFSHLVQNSPLIRRLGLKGKFWEHLTLVNSIKQLKQLQSLNLLDSEFRCSFDEALIEELIWKTCIYECKTIPVSNLKILEKITSVRSDFKCWKVNVISNGSRKFVFSEWSDSDDVFVDPDFGIVRFNKVVDCSI